YKEQPMPIAFRVDLEGQAHSEGRKESLEAGLHPDECPEVERIVARCCGGSEPGAAARARREVPADEPVHCEDVPNKASGGHNLDEKTPQPECKGHRIG